MCIDDHVNFILASLRDIWQLCFVCVNSLHVYNCLKDTVTEEMSLIAEPAHVAVGLKFLEMSSITTLKQTI